MKWILTGILAGYFFAGSVELLQAQTNTNFLTLDDSTRAFLKSALGDKWTDMRV